METWGYTNGPILPLGAVGAVLGVYTLFKTLGKSVRLVEKSTPNFKMKTGFSIYTHTHTEANKPDPQNNKHLLGF